MRAPVRALGSHFRNNGTEPEYLSTVHATGIVAINSANRSAQSKDAFCNDNFSGFAHAAQGEAQRVCLADQHEAHSTLDAGSDASAPSSAIAIVARCHENDEWCHHGCVTPHDSKPNERSLARGGSGSDATRTQGET